MIGPIRKGQFAGGWEWNIGWYVSGTFDIGTAHNFSWKNMKEEKPNERLRVDVWLIS